MSKYAKESSKRYNRKLKYVKRKGRLYWFWTRRSSRIFKMDFEPLEYRVPKVYDETTYKVYKYVKIKDIEILITPKDRLDDLEERYKLASPLFTYMKPEANENLEKYAYFLKMINQTRVSDIQEIEKEQEAFSKRNSIWCEIC